MILHVYVAGAEVLCANVEPRHVEPMLERLQWHMPALALHGRVTVALDSMDHSNVTYLCNRKDESYG